VSSDPGGANNRGTLLPLLWAGGMHTGRKDLLGVKPATFDLDQLLGPPPLIEGEDEDAYYALRGRIAVAVKPTDDIEKIWVRDFADNVWEAFRLRQAKASLMRSLARHGVERVITPLVDYHTKDKLVKGWSARERGSVKEVDRLLKKAGLNQSAIVGETLAANLDTFERIDGMIMSLEARRNATLREIERRRDGFATRLQRVVNQIEEADYREVPTREAAE
jgi:hypothetical protein